MKLMVVDDEPVLLNGIIRMIRKADTPFTEIVGACDAIDALQKLEQFQPDLIVTDIHMPEMDGLAFIREAQERNYCDRFVILTGYGDFAYAQQALRYQVIDYLLKPLDKEELVGVLAKIAQSIRADHERADELDLLLLKEHMLYNTPAAELPVKPEQLSGLLPHPYSTVIVLQTDENDPSPPAELLAALAGDLNQVFEKTYMLQSRFLRQAVLLGNGSRRATDKELEQACGKLFQTYRKPDGGFSIGVSGREDAAACLRELYVEALAAMFFNRYFYCCSIAVYRHEAVNIHDGYDNLVRYIEHAQEQQPSAEQIKKDMQLILLHVAGESETQSKLREQFLVCVGLYLQSVGLTPEAIWGEQAAADLFSPCGEALDEARVADIVSQLIRCVRRPDHRQPHMQTIDKIVAFVALNYKLDLSLDMVADHVHMHPNYISTLFRKEMGMTFLHYLHTFRLNKAKKFMQEHPDWPINAIAESVGYENPRHFFKVFKKFENVTPGQFRLGGSIS
ncbi:response regulator [Paenibacillus sp. MBLB4367]|uniref:response regulator n=1 Tax=Paenibacillus sp. MBLB4367 TaxID=3384767 RepID=UPI0039083F31